MVNWSRSVDLSPAKLTRPSRIVIHAAFGEGSGLVTIVRLATSHGFVLEPFVAVQNQNPEFEVGRELRDPQIKRGPPQSLHPIA